MDQKTALDVALIAPIVLAVLVALFSRFVLGNELLKRRMGLPNWDFSKSWASTIAVVGGVISFATALALIPATGGPPTVLARGQYAFLGVVFTAVTAAAPPVYTFASGIQPDLTVRGWGYSFLFASIFTIWGTLGQLWIDILLIGDLCTIVALTNWWPIAVEAPLWVLGIALLCYAARSIIATVRAQPDRSLTEAVPPRWALL